MTLDKKEKERLYGRSWPGSVLQERVDTFLGEEGVWGMVLFVFCFVYFAFAFFEVGEMPAHPLMSEKVVCACLGCGCGSKVDGMGNDD